MTTPPPTGCDLCGVGGRLTMALLRVAWEDRTVLVRVCQMHSAMAWRTVEELRLDLLAKQKAKELA